jgi:thioredoxin-like negative regulator of GroEL
MKYLRKTLAALPLVCSLVVFAGLSPAPAQAAPALPSTNVAWLPAASDADVDRAFAKARAESKPVLMYWGATWCPPCNQLKATFFNRQDFATQSRSFVAVHVDGDRPGAQRVGTRFKVSGYPTVVLFTPQGVEITRLPGEVDAEQMMTVLQLGLSGGRPVKVVLADARAGKALTANEWRMLAYYSWDTDEQQLVPKSEVPALLGQFAALTASSPAADAEITTRLWLKALGASDDGKGIKPDAALKARVERVLGDAALSRLHSDVLTGEARDIVRVLTSDDSADRAPLLALFDTSLKRLQQDATLSRGDRISALIARVNLARIGQPKDATTVTLPESLRQEVLDTTAQVDRELAAGYERELMIPAAGYALSQAGLWQQSEALLTSNLKRAQSPYYLMSQLGGNARKLGKKDEALRWYRQSFETSVGPATRLQWGSGYLAALVDLAPADAPQIEKTAARLISEAAKDQGAFSGRSVRSLQRVSTKLVSWNADGKQAAVLRRLQAQLTPVCAKASTAAGQREACQALLKPAAKKA